MAGDMILDNIEEFVFDEDRVVSYKWLSRSLSLHVNHAKRKLEEFTEHWRTKEPSKPITVTFFISGVQETTTGNELTRVAIVREDDLERAKKRLKETHCQHIYSVQKSALKDTGALYQTDYDETKKKIYECNKFSAITCKAAQPRAPEERDARANQQISNGSVEPVTKTTAPERPLSQATKKNKPKGLAAFMNKPKVETKPQTKEAESKTSTSSTAKQTAKNHGKGSLMHAFASSKKTTKPPANKKDDDSPPTDTKDAKETKTEISETKDPSSSSKEDKRVDAQKSVNKKVPLFIEDDDELPAEETKAPAKETEAPAGETKATAKETKATAEETKPSARSAAVKKTASKAANKKASKRGISKLDTESKSKRRRVIQEISSSESEGEDVEDIEMRMAEEQEEEPEDTPIPPTPEPSSRARVSAQDTPTGKNGRRKVWKKVRYVDEDGCMVTDRVFESESEGEEDGKTEPAKEKEQTPEAKKDASSPDTKKSSPPSAGRKQAALTSFFKKR